MVENEFIPGLEGIKPCHKGCIATIGSFDGVHKGHQQLLRQVLQRAASLGLPSVVIVFEPQPYEYFSKEKAPARLMRLREKVLALHELGITRVLCLKFNAYLRNLTANAFVDEVLVGRLGVKHLEIGDDFRFGCDRQGDFNLLKSQGLEHGFSVSSAPTYEVNGARVSSTRIRQLLERDELNQVPQLLDKRFEIVGRVVYGKQLGRTIGVPTANVGLGRFRSPVKGVFTVRLCLECQKHKWWDGVANVGVRPTVTGGAKPMLEVHLFDFNQALYGEFVRVAFYKKIRNEQAFANLAALKAQIDKDIAQAKSYFDRL